MLSFRQKIFISYIAVFFLFIALLFPFATRTVNDIVTKSMVERADELIEILRAEPDDYALIATLKNSKHKVFFRVGIYNEDRKVLYDSHAKRRLGPKFSQEYAIDHPEVNEAFEKGIGTYEDYSDISEQKMYYLAKSFDFHGKRYVLRVAVPYQYVLDFTQNFEIGFLGLATAVLLLFTIMTWFIINHLTNPIQQIINAVRPYQEGHQTTIPKINIKSSNPKDDFGRLANTLNSLTARIQTHIDTLTDERNEKEAVLESLVEGVVSVDNDCIVNYANLAALKFLRMSSDELVGKPFSITNQHKCNDLLHSCMENEQALTDDLIHKMDGRKVYFDIVAAPKKAQTGAVLVMQDKSSHYRILEMRKDFIANASHELKTPITIIQGFAETLYDNPTLPEETTVEITSKIVRNCKRMTNLIKDLLTLADIDHLADSRLTRCDLTHLVDNCSQMLYDAHPTAIVNINIENGKDFHTIADQQLLELAVINLVENAAKYSNDPAHITITLKHLGENIEISVADKGIGIPKEDIDSIFHRFYTVDKAHSRKMGGSGLGLSLVETIIDKHLGKIRVESEIGKGTKFTIHLPVKRRIIE
jgi:two-component system, OmpR family, phosphate regulon sensor histidine kinase PhoR